MHRLLRIVAVPVSGGSLVAGFSQAAEPNPRVASQKQPETRYALYRHDGNSTTLIPPATGEHQALYPFLIGAAPPASLASQSSAAQEDSSKLAVGQRMMFTGPEGLTIRTHVPALRAPR